MIASDKGDAEMVNMLWKAGADVNQQGSGVSAAIGLAVCGSVCLCKYGMVCYWNKRLNYCDTDAAYGRMFIVPFRCEGRMDSSHACINEWSHRYSPGTAGD